MVEVATLVSDRTKAGHDGDTYRSHENADKGGSFYEVPTTTTTAGNSTAAAFDKGSDSRNACWLRAQQCPNGGRSVGSGMDESVAPPNER